MRRVLAGLILSGAFGLASAESGVRFDVPVQPLADAVRTVAAQSNTNIFMDAAIQKQVGQRKSVPLSGELTLSEALTRLLDGTGLTYEFVDATTLTITRKMAEPVERNVKLRQAQASTPEQRPEPSSEKLEELDLRGIPEILVTGSKSRDTFNVDVVRTEDDPQAYTILDRETIERSGAVTVEDFLKKQLTMNTTVRTNSQSEPGIKGTTSSINLRGLGSNETLILINGRRSAGVSIVGDLGQPDINAIPLSSIERIEVLPTSASAIYGGAAVGGVVNIVLKKQFKGGELRYSYDKVSASDGNQRTLSGNWGTSLASGTQLMLSGHYSEGDPLLVGDRLNVFKRGIDTILANNPAVLYSSFLPFFGATPNISSAPAFGVVPEGAPGAFCFDGLCFGFAQPELVLKNGAGALGSTRTYIPAGAGPGTDLSAGLLQNAGSYNFNLANGTGQYQLQSPFGSVPRTHSISANVQQSIFNDGFVFAHLSSMGNSMHAARSPFSTGFQVPASAPTNPFEQDVFVTFPLDAGASAETDNITKSATLGLVLPLRHGWSAELDYTVSRTRFDSALGDLDSQAFTAALSAGEVNPFVDTAAFAPNVSSYLTRQTYSGQATLGDAALRASGTIGKFPGGYSTLTIGLGHRREATGDADFLLAYPLTPQNSVQYRYFGQAQSTDSVYAEALLPVISAANHFYGVRSFDIQLAGRSERYTVNSGTPFEVLLPVDLQVINPPQGVHVRTRYTSTNPTIAVAYQPVNDFKFRASFGTAFLPPTARQLLPDARLACGSSPCRAISDPQNGSSYFVNVIAGGNQNLEPQRSRSWNFGLIWQPSWQALQGTRVNLEYYKITQPNYIVLPDLQTVVSDPGLADRVTRDPETGLITVVDTTYLNATTYRTSGWDFKANYTRPPGFGTLDFQLHGTVIDHDLRQYAIGSPFVEYSGYPNDSGESKVRGSASLAWNYGHWNTAWTTTYSSSYWQIGVPGSPTAVQNPEFVSLIPSAQGSNSVPSQIYHDIYVEYSTDAKAEGAGFAGGLLSNVSINFGVNNVFNKMPPFDANFTPYYYSTLGDLRMRTFRLGVSKKF